MEERLHLNGRGELETILYKRCRTGLQDFRKFRKTDLMEIYNLIKEIVKYQPTYNG